MIPKKYYYLKDIFKFYSIDIVQTRRLIDLGIPKHVIYELSKLKCLDHSNPDKGILIQVTGSDKISSYWSVTFQGLEVLEKYFSDDKSLIEDVKRFKKHCTKELLKFGKIPKYLAGLS